MLFRFPENGGFHLAPAPDDYLRQVMAELGKFDLEHVMPMHCSGQNFVRASGGVAPKAAIRATTIEASASTRGFRLRSTEAMLKNPQIDDGGSVLD